jgi:hypothetical protein
MGRLVKYVAQLVFFQLGGGFSCLARVGHVTNHWCIDVTHCQNAREENQYKFYSLI